jgi:hypothetical protein
MTQEIKDLDAWFEHMARGSRCRKLKALRLAEREGEALVLCAERRDGWVMGALITPDADGRWRVTWFNRDGFSGHGIRDTKFAAIHEAIREGYHDTNRNLLDEMM